ETCAPAGLLHTRKQSGGAIAVAAASTIATTFTSHYVTDHPGASAFGGPALTYGFQVTFYVLAGVAALAAVLAAVLIEPKATETEEVAGELELPTPQAA